MKFIFPLLFLSIFFVCCNTKNIIDSIQEVETINETTKQSMFNVAYTYPSSAPYYVVAIIKNKNTGETKEICTEAPFLEGALHTEFEKDYSYCFNLDRATTRNFELSKDSALLNISFDLYSHEELLSYNHALNIDSIVSLVKKEKHASKYFTSEQCVKNEREMFAHIMFNHGIMMSRGCLAGNICELVLFDSTKVGIPFLEPDWNYY